MPFKSKVTIIMVFNFNYNNIYTMKNVIKNGFYTSAGLFLISLNSVSAIDVTKTQKVSTWDNSTGTDFIATLNNMLGYLIGILYFIAVLFALYGWFQILTAWWDEEKVKSGKTTLINAVIGLVVIFLASNIITWIINIMTAWGWAIGS